MYSLLKRKILRFEFFLRFFRNFVKLLKILVTTRPNNLDVINKLHLMHIEHGKLQNNLRNLKLQTIENLNCYNELTPNDELSIYSQNGEDGITLKILSKLDVTRGSYIELGAGGYTSNTQILSKLGWDGTCFDGNAFDLKLARDYFTLRGIDQNNTNFVENWITKENINNLIKQHSSTDIDLLSVDLDGMDYWILQALEIKPKVIILEYNASFCADISVCVPYKNDFYRWNPQHSSLGWYYGASLSAYTEMLREKGYQLVYCEITGVNAFYVKSEIVKAINLKVQNVSDAFYADQRRTQNFNLIEQISHVQQYPLINV